MQEHIGLTNWPHPDAALRQRQLGSFMYPLVRSRATKRVRKLSLRKESNDAYRNKTDMMRTSRLKASCMDTLSKPCARQWLTPSGTQLQINTSDEQQHTTNPFHPLHTSFSNACEHVPETELARMECRKRILEVALRWRVGCVSNLRAALH